VSAATTPRYGHAMPFGATVLPRGGVRFRLWAPADKRIELAWTSAGAPGAPPRRWAAPRDAQGWREVVVHEAAAHDAYRWIVHEPGAGEIAVPDPAARANPDGVHGASRVVDPGAFEWDAAEAGWSGRPWHEAVVCEIHVGAFTPEGTFEAAARRLPQLADAGITAVQLMPLASFGGRFGWGYDGVLHYAPHAAYGTPDDLKRFVQAAHRLGLMVMVDVVYNHFGPDGNYLALYAPTFFDASRHTAWGAAIAFDGPDVAPVRAFFRHNALYWLEEFRADGLRFDAAHAIADTSSPDILEEIAAAAHALGRAEGRAIHLVLENEHNDPARLGPGDASRFEAQWNDDFHHAWHVRLTGERDGYYRPFADDPAGRLARCLAGGFAHEGPGETRADGVHVRRPATRAVPLSATLNFLHNHDQIGNRAFGERLVALADGAPMRLAVATMLLAPAPCMLFMGETHGATTPFLYFADWSGDLRRAVTEGRRREFAHFPAFADPATRDAIPDPCDPATFARSTLDWDALRDGAHARWFAFYRELLALRRAALWPVLPRLHAGPHAAQRLGEDGLVLRWRFARAHGSGDDELVLCANVGARPLALGLPPAGGRENAAAAAGETLFVLGDVHPERLGPWSARWSWHAARSRA